MAGRGFFSSANALWPDLACLHFFTMFAQPVERGLAPATRSSDHIARLGDGHQPQTSTHTPGQVFTGAAAWAPAGRLLWALLVDAQLEALYGCRADSALLFSATSVTLMSYLFCL